MQNTFGRMFDTAKKAVENVGGETQELFRLVQDLKISAADLPRFKELIGVKNVPSFVKFYLFLKKKNLIDVKFFQQSFEEKFNEKQFAEFCNELMNHVIANIKEKYPLKDSNGKTITLTPEQKTELEEVAKKCIEIAKILEGIDTNKVISEQLNGYEFLNLKI